MLHADARHARVRRSFLPLVHLGPVLHAAQTAAPVGLTAAATQAVLAHSAQAVLLLSQPRDSTPHD